MKLQKTLVVSFAAALALAGGASGAHADSDGPKFQTNGQILSCDTIEVLDLRLLSSAPNNIDCSKNYEKETNIKEETKVFVAPEQRQGQGQAQEQEGEQDQRSKMVD